MSSLFDLTGNVALVTGSSRGIGRAAAMRLAEHGATVVVSSRSIESCQPVADDIVAAGGSALAIACHIGYRDQLVNLVAAANEAYGRVDVVVANAAISTHKGPILEMTDEAFDKVMATNVRGILTLAQLTVPDMAARGGGSFIVVSSIAGLRGSPGIGGYAVSKAADGALVRSIAIEWSGKGVRANCVAPGLIRTDFARPLWDDPSFYEARIRETPMRRIGEADEIAGTIVYLASPASAFMTGQTVVVDGGVTIGSPPDPPTAGG
jgi:NAD(P)-dependent dehydrogenase (short-subunit alcohol dehydrogenase family)